MRSILTTLLGALLFSVTQLSIAQPEFGHVAVLDPQTGLRDIFYENIKGYAVVEDDIALMKLPNAKSTARLPQAMILLKLGGFRWPQSTIPFKFAPALSRGEQLKVLNAMDSWQKSTHIRFVEITQADQDKYSDYILFIPSNAISCFSSVGRTGGLQIIMLGSKCKTSMHVAHEIGHALGLWHEQSRNDRDQYIKILWDNIEDEHLFNFNQHINDGQDFGDYDYQSIMHYSSDNFSKNGKETIVPLVPGVTIGQRDRLSAKDIAAVNAMYP